MIDREIYSYLEEHSSSESPLLARIRRETHLRTVYPQMLTGPIQGKLLEMISRMTRPGRILEIGTFTGYSAICLASGLDAGGKLFTIDINPEMTAVAREYFREAGLDDRITAITGNALELVSGMNETFDLVYIDAAKEDYTEYYCAIIDKVRIDGYILADNVLWDGKVLEAVEKHDKETAGIVSFNRYIKQDSRVEQVLLPLRDGLMIARKITS